MAERHIFIWTGGQLDRGDESGRLAEALPLLPAPAPLLRAAQIQYYWGDTKFDIWATACSVRTTAWGVAEMTWLHCKAMHVPEIKPDEPTNLATVLIPVYYVTSIQPGPTFRLSRSQPSEELAIFPPNRPAPEKRLALEEVERCLTALLAPERN
jgi:hypothetical protein